MSTTISSLPSSTGNTFDIKLKQLRKRISGRLRQGFYSTFDGYGLRRDLSQPLEKRPKSKIPIAIRPLVETDLDLLLPAESGVAHENLEITWRRHFYRKAPKNCCFVGVDLRNNTPCFMQWLIGSEHNEALTRFKCFPRLESNEAIIEQAYIIPSHRGLGIMSVAINMVAEKASDMGVRYVLAFSPDKAIVSLRAFRHAGFYPYTLHQRTQIGYGSIVYNRFNELAIDDPRITMML